MISTCQINCAHWRNSTMRAIGSTTSLNLRSDLQERFYVWYCKSGQKTRTGGTIGHLEKPTDAISLNGYAAKLPT